MNKKQKIVMWAAIGILVGMLLVPPWRHTARAGGGAVGYSPVFMKPREIYYVVDIPRLMLPVCIVVLVAAGLFVTFRSRKSDREG